MSEKHVAIGAFIGRTQADLAAAHLRASGIDAEVVSDEAGGAIPSLELASRVKVLVPESNETGAREILEKGGHFYEGKGPAPTAQENFWGWVLVALSGLALLWLFF